MTTLKSLLGRTVDKRALSDGNYARDQGDWTRAAACYERYLRSRPTHFAIWVQLGHALKESGRQLEALASYSRALALNERDSDLLLNIGRLHKLMGHRRLAVDFYYRSFAADSNEHAINELRMLGVPAPTAPTTAPSGLIKIGERSRSLLKSDIRRTLDMANKARDRRDWPAAAEGYRRYLKKRSDNFAIWVQLGHALKENGQLDGALGAYGKAFSLNSSDPDLLLNLGHLHNLLGSRDMAIDYYRRSSEQDGNVDAKNELERMGAGHLATGGYDTTEGLLRPELVRNNVKTTALISGPALDQRLSDHLERAENTVLVRKGSLDQDFKNTAFYALNTRNLSPSHRQTLISLKENKFSVVLINSIGGDYGAFIDQADGLYDLLLIKEDQGRDFSSWITAFMLVRNQISDDGTLLFLNDSLIGPINDLGRILNIGIASDVDLWGLSDSYQHKYHIQSSFFMIKNGHHAKIPFLNFVASYTYPCDKDDVIRWGEIELSQALLAGGLKTGVLCPYEELCGHFLASYPDLIERLKIISANSSISVHGTQSANLSMSGGWMDYWAGWSQNLAISVHASEPRNAQHVFWDIMITKYGYPFIKRGLITENPERVPGFHDVFGIISEKYLGEGREMLIYEARQCTRAPPPIVRPLK